MEQKLHFIRTGEKEIGAFVQLTEGDRIYMRDINKDYQHGLLDISKEDLTKHEVDLRTFVPNKKLMTDLAKYGSPEQRRVQMAFPTKGIITGGVLRYKDDKAYITCTLDKKDYLVDIMGAGYVACQLGRILNPWVIEIDGRTVKDNPEYPMMVQANTVGLEPFFGHPDIQFVLRLPPNAVFSLLNGIASSIQDGDYLRDGELLKGTFDGRRLMARLYDRTPENDTKVFRIIVEDKNRKFPEDDGVDPIYGQQAIPTDELFNFI